MKLSKKSEKLLKELIEIRFVNSQKKGWVAITKGDRDWNSGISEDELQKHLQKNWAKDHIKFMNKNRGI